MDSRFNPALAIVVNDIKFNVYLDPPEKGGPLLVLHHGMGSSAATFALFIDNVRKLMNTEREKVGILAFDCRFHGQSEPIDQEVQPTFDLKDLVDDCDQLVKETLANHVAAESVPLILLGHSMGGTVVSTLCNQHRLPNVQGLVVLDAVEGYAVQALRSMPTLVSMWPTDFESEQEAIEWTVKHNQVRNAQSAEISVPPLLKYNSTTKRFHWRVNLLATKPWWDTWFVGLDDSFLKSGTANLLLLAGTGRLDKELMIGQMQGKYQLVVLNDSGHFIQEDHPHKTAVILEEFWTRNQRPVVVPRFGKFRE